MSVNWWWTDRAPLYISSSRRSWAFWAHWPVTMDNAQWNVPHPQFYSGARTQWVENVCYRGNNGLTMGPPLIAPASAASPTNLSFVNSPNKVFTLIQGKEDPNRNESTIDLSRQEVDIGYWVSQAKVMHDTTEHTHVRIWNKVWQSWNSNNPMSCLLK